MKKGFCRNCSIGCVMVSGVATAEKPLVCVSVVGLNIWDINANGVWIPWGCWR